MKRSRFQQKPRKPMKRTPLRTKTPLRAKKRPVAKRKAKSKEKTQAQLKKQLDSVFSLFIRNKYADKNGIVHCYTCSVRKPVKEIQNGHWIPRNNLATRFSEENCRPQCVGCNMFQKGKPDVFAVNLIAEGIDIVELQKTRNAVFKIDKQWYKDMIQKYTI